MSTPVVIDHTRLVDAAQEFNRIIGSIGLIGGGKRSDKLVAAGKVLCEIKGMLPHGEFYDYLKYTLQIEPRNAQRWMQRYEQSMEARNKSEVA